MGLEARTVPVGDLSGHQRQEMLRLMRQYYVNVTARQFTEDLDQKQHAILLYDGGLRGFSTWVLFPHECDGRRVNVIFSGDTIIEKSHWRSLALPLEWGRMMLSVLARHPGEDLYWLLTSKGYKTYRFLPVFFREFYPSYVKQTPPFEAALLVGLCRYKYGERFDAASWVIRAGPAAERLRPGVADLTDERQHDPHVVFFERANPGHARGDELACIARCHPNNLSPFILRHLERRQ